MLHRVIHPVRLLAIAVALGIAGCGSSTPAVGQAFATSATAACAHALALKQAEGPFPVASFNPTKPDPAKLAEVAVFLHLTDATFTTWVSELEALGMPPSGQAPWADLVAAAIVHRDNNRDQIAAAERGDTATFAADYHLGVATQAKFLAAANAAGVPDCAKVDR
jgi:hypothetical protein